MTYKLVIVESPAKAKTINKYLGSDYKVIASFGHIRDLPSKNGSVDPDKNFEMIWQVPDNSKKHFIEIKKQVKNASCIYLASDPDREGEAIAWHIIDALHQYKTYQKIPYKRITFNEITKKAVKHAIANPRELDQELIDAYLARLSLDYLVGFNLSPVLWRKLPGSKSAGRVQSVALKLICEREFEIEAFKNEEYWSIHGAFASSKDQFDTKLSLFNGKKIEKFSMTNQANASTALASLKAGQYHVESIEAKKVKRNPYAPFTTSTLQQDASHKLGFGTSKTMRVAQKLYEGISMGGETTGLITYMRTDGVQIGDDAIIAIRSHIEKNHGASYLPSTKRIYKTKAKNAQEAHEAIRPTSPERTPDSLKTFLSSDELKLYNLIWRRALASQMQSAQIKQVRAGIMNQEKTAEFKATGSTITFDGFYKIYKDSKKGENETILPPLEVGMLLTTKEITSEQHFTQPPARYSEAGLVKKLEELGIGRPSTYASIIKVLQDRNYVTLDQKRFLPETRGRLVSSFLSEFFSTIMLYDFTANLEKELDEISNGKREWRAVLKEFWNSFTAKIEEANALKIIDVLDYLDRVLEKHFFPPTQEGGEAARACPKCKEGTLHLKLGKFGSFAGCSNYPDCNYSKPLERSLVDAHADGAGHQADLEPQILGLDPQSKTEISLRKGPYGFYVQRDLTENEKVPILTKTGKVSKRQPKPRRMSLQKGMKPDDVTLETASKLLELPKTLGMHPETNLPIKVSLGRFGPYIHYNEKFKSIPAADDVLNIRLDRAIEILNTPSTGRGARGGAKAEAIILAMHPSDKKPITFHEGPYGPYIKHGKINASLPKDKDPKSFSAEDLKTILDERIEKKKG